MISTECILCCLMKSVTKIQKGQIIDTHDSSSNLQVSLKNVDLKPKKQKFKKKNKFQKGNIDY